MASEQRLTRTLDQEVEYRSYVKEVAGLLAKVNEASRDIHVAIARFGEAKAALAVAVEKRNELELMRPYGGLDAKPF